MLMLFEHARTCTAVAVAGVPICLHMYTLLYIVQLLIRFGIVLILIFMLLLLFVPFASADAVVSYGEVGC